MQTVCVIKKGWQIHWVFIYHHLCLVIPFLKKKSSRLKQICRRGEDVYRSHFTRKEKERRRERERERKKERRTKQTKTSVLSF